MTIYAKRINNKLVLAHEFSGITGLVDNPELCIMNGFKPYDEVEYSLYLAGKRELLDDDTLRDITQDTLYLQEQKKQEAQQKIQEIQQLIVIIEQETGPRAVREALLNNNQVGIVTSEFPNGKLKDLDTKISDLRKQLKEYANES